MLPRWLPSRSRTGRPSRRPTRTSIVMAGSGDPVDDVRAGPGVEGACAGARGRDGEVYRAVDFRDHVHRDTHRIGRDGGMQSLPYCDDPSADAAAQSRPGRAGAAEQGCDVGVAVGIEGDFEIVDLRERPLVAVDDLAVEERKVRVHGE